MTRARSTNMRERIDSVCERMIRAVVAQDVMPMTMTMTTSVARNPMISASTPMMSRMTGARMIASTNVGRTRKKSVSRIRPPSTRPPVKPATTPMSAPTKIVIAVASSPIDIETRAPWTVRLSMSRPSSSVPKMCSSDGGSSGAPVAVTGVWSGPTNSVGAMARTVKTMRMARPTTPSFRPANRRPNVRAPATRRRQRSARRFAAGGAGVSGVALMPGPSGRGTRRPRRRPGWPPRR